MIRAKHLVVGLLMSSFAVVMIPQRSAAQGGIYVDRAEGTRPISTTTALVPLPYANVLVCSSAAQYGPGAPVPCSPPATVYTSASLAAVQPNSTYTADQAGNFQVFASPGNYVIQVSASGYTAYTYPVTVPATSVIASVAIGSPVSNGATPGRNLTVSSSGTLSQSPNYIHTEQMIGADCGVRYAAAQAALSSGGTIDMTGETNCTLSTQNLVFGDNTHSYTVWGPTSIARGELSSTGVSASICYNSYVTLHLENTAITGPGDVNPAMGECYSSSGVAYTHIHGGNLLDTGSVVPGYSVFNFGGPNANMTLPAPPTASGAFATSDIGSQFPGASAWFTGAMARVAIYNTALSAATIATNYANHTNLTTYDAGILANSPVAYWKLNETTGTSAADSSGNGRTATYHGTCTLGVANGINGAADTAAEFDGSSCYVRLPNYQYFTGGNYTITVWANATTLNSNNPMLNLAQANIANFWLLTDNPPNGGMLVAQQVNSGGEQLASRPAAGLTLNTWVEVDAVYSNGGVVIYLDGAPLAIGTEVGHSTVDDLIVGGSDYGFVANSLGGCICDNKVSHVQAEGASIGFLTLNQSGFAAGVNADEFNSITGNGPIGIADYGTNQTRWSGAHDLESNESSTGQVILAEPDALSLGSSYVVGDVVTGTGCTINPTFTVLRVNGSGALNPSGTTSALAVTTRGSGCTNATNVSTTGGSGTGLTVNYHVSASFIAMGVSDNYDAPYIFGSANVYMGGGGNVISGPYSGVVNGSTFNPVLAPGTTVCSNFWLGPNAAAPCLALQNAISGIGFGLNGFLYDPFASYNFQSSNSDSIELYGDGPAYAYVSALTYGLYGWHPWHMGESITKGGTVAAGQTTFSKIADPGAPTLTSICTAGGGLTCGATSLNYSIVFNDFNNGHTAVVSPATQITNAPSVLGAIMTATVYPPNPGSGFTSGTVGETCTVTGGDGTGEITINSVSGGKVTGVSPTSGNLGSKYITNFLSGNGGSPTYATSCATGTGLYVTITSSAVEISWAQTQGLNSVTVLETDTTHQLNTPASNAVGTTNPTLNRFDYGNTYISYSAAVSQNTTGLVIFNSFFQLVKTAFANLPSCVSALQGYTASISDSTTNTWGGTISGSGGDAVIGYCDGSNWTVVAK
jgi:concanavalin A-like lectin/glucanase superfamily protein